MISSEIKEFMRVSSSIREMFEKGARLKAEFGDENVHDFSIGNPVLPPPAKLYTVLQELLKDQSSGKHRYMQNAGFLDTRRHVSTELSGFTGLEYMPDDICMTVGAAGGLNTVLKSLLSPGDEVIVLAPFFPEYRLYISNHGGRTIVVNSLTNMAPDINAISKAVTSRTKALFINSPNNPSGHCYSETELDQLATLLKKAGKIHGTTIYLISDEPYRNILFDGLKPLFVTSFYKEAIIVYSYSKELGIPGERIGYVAVSPECSSRNELRQAIVFSNRALGFVNAPALMQRALPEMAGELVGVSEYESIRNELCDFMVEAGFEFVRPQGAFFLFPKSPIADDFKFCQTATDKCHVLFVPGTLFGMPGHFRMSYCLEPQALRRAFPAIKSLMSLFNY